MKRAQLRRMLFDGFKPDMRDLAVCDEMICVTPVNSILRGVILSPFLRSRHLRVVTFARPLFCPDASMTGASSTVGWGLLQNDVWDFDELEDPRVFQRLLDLTRRKVRRLSLVDTPERFAKNYLWVFGPRVTGWAWLRIGFSYAHMGHYKKAARILRRKVLTWDPQQQVHAILADYANPMIEAIDAGNHQRVRALMTQREETTIGEFQAYGANLNALF